MSKFRKWNSPAFNKGEVWLSSTGSRVYIIDVVRYPAATGEHSSDYEVTYYTDDTKSYTYSKDCWNFQVRYSHWSDLSPHKNVLAGLLFCEKANRQLAKKVPLQSGPLDGDAVETQSSLGLSVERHLRL